MSVQISLGWQGQYLMRAIDVFARSLMICYLTPHPHFTCAFATTLQTLHHLRTDQLQLTSSGCHFAAYNFRLASRFVGLPLFNTTPATSTKTIQPFSTKTPAIAVAPAAQHSGRPAAQHEPSNIRTNDLCRLWIYKRLTTSPTDDR
jgi:hypothetical protein